MDRVASQYYDGSRLLSLKDINKDQPEIYISVGVRSAGKTTYFSKKLVDDFLRRGKKFCLLYRYAYECNGVADKFFNQIGQLFFPNFIMTQEPGEKDTFVYLYIQDRSDPNTKTLCGYCCAINKSVAIKKLSHLIQADILFFDEFQPEDGVYAPDEINKFQSIHTSLARGLDEEGNSKQVKYLPVILCSNYVSVLNPYFSALGVTDRIQKNTNFLRGEGWVLEQSVNKAASDAQRQSAFNRAFKNSEYTKYASEKFYLNDDESLIAKLEGDNTYILTFRFEKHEYALRQYPQMGILYVSKNVDNSCKCKYAVTTDDMNEYTRLIKGNSILLSRLRDNFDAGAFRFSDLESKNALFNLLSY